MFERSINNEALIKMVILRPMQQEDVEGVMAIETTVTEFPWTASIFSDCIKVGYGCWILDDEGSICGYGLISSSAGEAHILNISIKPERQGQKLGLRMMRHLIKQAKYLKCASVFLEVRVSNKRAIDLYNKLGFVKVGDRKDYYPATEGREDAHVMSLALITQPSA